jgi:hypothetical protein
MRNLRVPIDKSFLLLFFKKEELSSLLYGIEDAMNYSAKPSVGDAITTAEELAGPVTIGVDAYISQEYARAERDRLWRKTWLQAGRVEDIPAVGSYLTYWTIQSLSSARLQTRSKPITMSARIAAAAWSIRRREPATRAARR